MRNANIVIASRILDAAGKIPTLSLRILFRIHMAGEYTMLVHQLSEALNYSIPAISRSLDGLEKKGLVKRKRDTADRRQVFVHKTIKGEAFLKEITKMFP